MTIEPQQPPCGPSRTTEWRQRWGLHTPATLRLRARELGGSNYLVEGLLPARSISLVLGDSGVGKSPLMYQLGICVAAGLPFLGRPTRQGRVVIADFENGIADSLEMIERISGFLGLPGPPSQDAFFVWTLNDCLSSYGQLGHGLLDMLQDVGPALAVIDSLGSYSPEAEEKNSNATKMLQQFRHLTRDHGTAAVLVHHRRKQSRNPEESAGALENTLRLRHWFQEARGASTLINGSDLRLGVDDAYLSATQNADVALVVRGFGRVRGEIGPLYLARVPDETGKPIGYRLVTGPELLNEKQQTAFGKLPQQFSFKDAKLAYGHVDQATRNWLLRSIDLGILKQSGRGVYEKLRPEGAAEGGVVGEKS